MGLDMINRIAFAAESAQQAFSAMEKQQFGYETKTTFWKDFFIAEIYGIEAVKDTFERAFNEWKDNIEYITELSIVTNLRCNMLYEQEKFELSEAYHDMYYKVYDYVYSDSPRHFTEEQINYYWQITD